MTAFLWIGTLLGASFGLLHGAWVARQQFAVSGDLTRALWFALWTLVLWTVFGAYLLAFWLIGAAAYALSSPFRREEAAR